MENIVNTTLGVDLVGFPKGALGVGEQIRSLIRVCEKNNYDINVIDCFESDNFQNNIRDYQRYISGEFKHRIRIYSATHTHMVALLWKNGFNFFNNAYNIFHLAWEFAEIKSELRPILSLADEIWGISSFTSRAFSNSWNIPVYTVPNAVEVTNLKNRSREYFNLPDGRFLFCISFDFNSFISRKNPMMAIDAFLENFLENDNVGLVVKVSNLKQTSSHWKDVHRKIVGKKNIYLIDDILDRDDLIALYNTCDAFISLHRSEGFGFNIAEFILLNKPVICTAFSGNMDYCNEKNSYLVDYDLRKVKYGEYDNAEGLTWAEPSLDDAIVKVKKAYDMRYSFRDNLSISKNIIAEEYSPAKVAGILNTRVCRNVYE